MQVLHRDEALIVVDKPSGLAVHRGWATDRVVALDLARRAAGRHVYPVHRLDRGTSGVLVFAMDPVTARQVQEAFEAGAVEKRYLALVRGIAPLSCFIDHAIPGHEGGPRVPAQTQVCRLHELEVPCGERSLLGMSVVEAFPRTGRLHQVRRHLKHISHPVLGDSTHGKGKLNREVRAQFGLARLALHASVLTLPHPRTGELLRLYAPMPLDLSDPLRRMGLAWRE